MQKFEFCIVDIYYRFLITFTSNGWKEVRLKKDKKLGDQNDYDAAARAIAQLGLDGWELVGGASAEGRGINSILYFQRVVP